MNDDLPLPDRPRVAITWTDPAGNHRSVEVSGPQGFVKFWIDKLAHSALEKPIPPPSSPSSSS